MYLYQLGSFGYEEGEISPPIVLEHSEDFSNDRINEMIVEIRKEIPIASEEVMQRELCERYGFIVRAAKEINIY